MPVGADLAGVVPPSTPTLVVAGTHGSHNLESGSAYLNPQSGVNFNGPGGGPRWLASNPVNFGSAFTALRATSTAWGTAPATGTVTPGVSGVKPASGSPGRTLAQRLLDDRRAALASNKRLGLTSRAVRPRSSTCPARRDHHRPGVARCGSAGTRPPTATSGARSPA